MNGKPKMRLTQLFFEKVSAADEAGFQAIVEALSARRYATLPFTFTPENVVSMRAWLGFLEMACRPGGYMAERAHALLLATPRTTHFVRNAMLSAVLPTIWKLELYDAIREHLREHRRTCCQYCLRCGAVAELVNVVISGSVQIDSNGKRREPIRLKNLLAALRSSLEEEVVALAASCTSDKLTGLIGIAGLADEALADKLRALLPAVRKSEETRKARRALSH